VSLGATVLIYGKNLRERPLKEISPHQEALACHGRNASLGLISVYTLVSYSGRTFLQIYSIVRAVIGR
jgi:hypothetical protein